MSAIKRKYPVGIQSFESIRRDGYVYVDKTGYVYQLITEGKPYFLSRPRRFGKSLLISTIEAVFQGRRELFEAFTTEDGIEQPQLSIARTNWKWLTYPVLRFDFSRGKDYTIKALDEQIESLLRQYEQQYGITPEYDGFNLRFEKIVETAHQQTGLRVVVLVDEYDNFMLHSIGNREMEEAVRQRFANLFGPLKSLDDHLQFIFITGISKFSQMGIFSTLNQLNNISMQQDFDCICGITEEELTSQLRPDIEYLSGTRGKTFEETLSELKQMYDGYHFSRRVVDIYNPFSLISAFKSGEMLDYWFASGTTGALIDMLAQMPPIDLEDLEYIKLEANDFDQPLNGLSDPMPVLYQSGYLTIKDYIKDRDMYILGFPNQEVRKGFAGSLFQHVATTKTSRDRSQLLNAYYDFRDTDNLPQFIEALKAFYAGVPYQLDNKNEHHYHALLYTLLVAFGADVSSEESSAKGRSDIVLRMPKGIYVIELKYDRSAKEAMEQIERRDYARKYELDSRPITKVAINFSSLNRNIADWQSLSLK